MSTRDPNESNSQLEQARASDESIQRGHASLLKNSPDLQQSRSLVFLVLLGFASVMIFIASIYVVQNRGGFDPLAYDPRFDPRTAVAGKAAVVDPMVEGKKLFTTCATCHQPTGQGVPGVFPPLVNSEWVMGSEDRLIRILLSGLSGPIKVADVTYNNAMPAFGPGGYGWSDDKIAHVSTYIRQSWGNAGGPISVEKVTQIRTEIGQRKPWSEAELLAIP